MNNSPRNIVSRTRSLALRAAELYDEGATDEQVAAALSTEALKISARTARSFRLRDYEPLRAERLQRVEDAAQVELLMSAARESGVSFVQGAQDLYARTMYDLMTEVRRGSSDMEPKVLVAIGKNIAKFGELQIAQTRLELQQAEARKAADVKAAARANPNLDAATRELVLKLMDEKMLGVKA